MIIRNALIDDIEGIMNVESQAFIKEIQEKREVFEERLRTFPGGFFVLCDDNKEIIGYFSSEIWNDIPEDTECFTIGHSAKSIHNMNGKALYVSSIGLIDQVKGKGFGKLLFNECIKRILSVYKSVDKSVLIVNNLWKGAQHIYISAGYEKYNVLKDFFPTEDTDVYSDGILMRKDF